MPRPSRPRSRPRSRLGSRLGSRLFTVAAGVSAVLCVAVVVMWVRSYWVTEALSLSDSARGRELEVGTSRGQVYAYRATSDPMAEERSLTANEQGARFRHYRWPARPAFNKNRLDALRRDGATGSFGPLLGWAVFLHGPGRYGIYHVEAWVPYWGWFALTAAVPALCYYRLRVGRTARARSIRGLCPRCGYDLRATPGRCPECGTVPEQERPGI